MVHEVARQGFGSEAEIYEQARPSYPAELVNWFVEHLGIAADTRVVDLAAGTGKLTRLLAEHTEHLVAVEPVDGMRSVLARAVSTTAIVAATAEALPFEGSTVDVVTVAQAFHWFDHDAAAAELARVLRRGGRVGLVWNARDRTLAWVDELWAIMDRVERRAPWRDHENWRDSSIDDPDHFSGPYRAEFRHEHRLSTEALVARVASVSHVAVLEEQARGAVLDEVRALIANHPQTRGHDDHAVPYRVDAMWYERIA